MPLRRYSWTWSPSSSRTLTCGGSDICLLLPASPASCIEGRFCWLPALCVVAGATLGGGATGCTPGSLMPGGGSPGFDGADDCAKALEARRRLAAASRAAVFMAATSVGRRSIAAHSRVFREARLMRHDDTRLHARMGHGQTCSHRRFLLPVSRVSCAAAADQRPRRTDRCVVRR